MTKEKLLEFYNRIKQEEIAISTLRQFRNCNDSEIDLILNSKYPKVMMDIVLNYQFKLLSKNEREQIIKYINNAKCEQYAQGMYDIVSSGMVLSSGLTIKILDILDNSSIEALSSILSLALNNVFLLNPNSLEIMKIIGESTQEYSVVYATDIARNLESLIHPEIIEIIKIASKTEGEDQSKLVNSMAKNRDILAFDLSVELIKLASKARKDKKSIELMISVASNKLLDKYRCSTQYLVMMFESKTFEDILKIYNEVEQKIIDFKIKESRLKKDNELFWNVYKETPEKAIAILQNSKSVEITPYTRVRKRNENNE